MVCFAHRGLDEMLGKSFTSLENQGAGDNGQRSHPGLGSAATEIVPTSTSCVQALRIRLVMQYVPSESNPAEELGGGLQAGAAARDEISTCRQTPATQN
jgi:hypothetical protein